MTDEMIMLLNNIAITAHRGFTYITPYDTGNLARSVSDVGVLGNGVGFKMFDSMQSAPYGAILNEFPTISYKLTNKYTGKVYTGVYVNTHYRWIDNGMEEIVNVVCLTYGLRRT